MSDSSSAVHQAALKVNSLVRPAAVVPDPVPAGIQQRVLSSSVDAGALVQLSNPEQASLCFRSHMSLLKLDGACMWLHAIPCEALGTKVAPHLFVPMLQHRLCMPIFKEMFFCPLCDGAMDIWADHALTGACGVDQTKWHNLIHNVSVRLANSAGWPPDPEKLGLLQPRPSQGCWDEDSSEVRKGSRGSEARRPTDIYVLRRDLGGPTTLAGFGQICWSRLRLMS